MIANVFGPSRKNKQPHRESVTPIFVDAVEKCGDSNRAFSSDTLSLESVLCTQALAGSYALLFARLSELFARSKPIKKDTVCRNLNRFKGDSFCIS